MKKIVFILSLIFLLVACDKNDTNKIVEQVKAINPDNLFSSEIKCQPTVCSFILLSKSNDLLIKDISLNRGNCKIDDIGIFGGVDTSETIKNKQLKFGDRVIVVGWCQIIEVNLSTDKGDFTLTFK